MKNIKKQGKQDNKKITGIKTGKTFSFLLVCFLLSSASAVHASEMNATAEIPLKKTMENAEAVVSNGETSGTVSDISPIEANYSWEKMP